MARIKLRKGMPSVQLTKNEFAKRIRERFYDPDFGKLTPAIDKIIATAWRTYDEYHKSPRARRAGAGFADPDFKLPIEWLETRARIRAAERRQKDAKSPSRILIVNGSSRSDQTCPGEMSKTWRLVMIARKIVAKTRGSAFKSSSDIDYNSIRINSGPSSTRNHARRRPARA